jgi:flagellin-like hook-associated protein FlgL
MRILFIISGLVLFFSYLAAENSSLIYLNRILSGSDINYDKNVRRISGGRQLLADDPANYAIYETLEKHIRAFRKDIENKSDMVSYYNCQEAMMGSILDILQRIRALVLEKSGPLLSGGDRDIIDREIGQDYDQIVLELKESEFNGKRIFEGLFGDSTVAGLFRNQGHYSLDNVDGLIDYFIYQRTYAGAMVNRLHYEIAGERTADENMTESQSRGDTDIAAEMSGLTLNHLKMLVNLLMLGSKL